MGRQELEPDPAGFLPLSISLVSWSYCSSLDTSVSWPWLRICSTTSRSSLRRKLKSPNQKTWSKRVVTSATVAGKGTGGRSQGEPLHRGSLVDTYNQLLAPSKPSLPSFQHPAQTSTASKRNPSWHQHLVLTSCNYSFIPFTRSNLSYSQGMER